MFFVRWESEWVVVTSIAVNQLHYAGRCKSTCENKVESHILPTLDIRQEVYEKHKKASLEARLKNP
jgi:hypothetical protein